jgi:hypothetical protein
MWLLTSMRSAWRHSRPWKVLWWVLPLINLRIGANLSRSCVMQVTTP